MCIIDNSVAILGGFWARCFVLRFQEFVSSIFCVLTQNLEKSAFHNPENPLLRLENSQFCRN